MMRSAAMLCALLVVALLGSVAIAPAHAENFDLYPFESPEQEARFDRLTAELRCPKCQNQSLADSNAPIAQDLRKRTYELVREGRSDDEIVAYLKDRYGEFITYRPAFNVVTALLWAGPFLLLVIAGGILAWRLHRRATGVVPAAADPAVDADKVRDILERFDQEPRA